MVLHLHFVQPIKNVEVEIKLYMKMMLCMVCGLAYMHQIYDLIFLCHLEADK